MKSKRNKKIIMFFRLFIVIAILLAVIWRLYARNRGLGMFGSLAVPVILIIVLYIVGVIVLKKLKIV